MYLLLFLNHFTSYRRVGIVILIVRNYSLILSVMFVDTLAIIQVQYTILKTSLFCRLIAVDILCFNTLYSRL